MSSTSDVIHYPKIRRLPLYPVPYRKEVSSDSEIELLFSDEVVIEEKIDGKLYYIDYDNYTNLWREKILKLMRRPSHYGASLIEGVVIKL